MEWNDRQKKRLVTAGGIALCAALMALVWLRFRAAPKGGGEGRETESATRGAAMAGTDGSGDIKVDRIKPGAAGMEPEDGERAGKGQDPDRETKDALLPQTDMPTQKLQPDVPGPVTSPEDILRDPEKKPDGEPVEGTPAAVGHEEVAKPEESPAPEGEPRAGDTSGGKIYVPGFGWIEDKGGGAAGETAPDMYENGNKIGSMG